MPSAESRSFAKEITLFVQQIESLSSSLPIVMKLVGESARKARSEFTSYLKTAAAETRDNAGRRTYTVTGDDQILKFRRLEKNSDSTHHAFHLIPRSFVVSLVSQFDSYVGRLIRVVLSSKPEILNASERTLMFSDLMRFGSLDEACDFLIEKEVESVIRQSHAEHFAWFEKKLRIPLRDGLDAWPMFIEVTERRNLFVHCDGVVSSQYLSVCHQHNVALSPDCSVGRKLGVTGRYFKSAFECVYEVGVKLGQVLWRKLLPNELEEADSNLIMVSYDLLAASNYNFAAKLLDFATITLKKHSSEDLRPVLVINRAQAYKWSGKNDECLRILDAEDWSASSDKFKMGVAVLRNDFAAAAKFVEKIVTAPDFPVQSAYKEWPLFREFRKSPEFLKAYTETFHEQFKMEETTPAEKSQDAAPGLAEPPDATDSVPGQSIGTD